MNTIRTSLLFKSAIALALASTSAMAQTTNPNYAPGDLVLFFQQEGGSNTVYVDLGNAATLYRGAAAGATDGVNNLNIVNINAKLTSAFGAGWASDESVYAGLAGVWSDVSAGTFNTLQDGDPSRTLYVSSPRFDVGTIGEANSTGWDLSTAGNNALTTAATGITVQNNVLEEQYLTAVAVSPNAISQIDDMNPFFAQGLQDAAFQGALAGGVQQAGTAGSFGTFGAAGTVEFALDLFRVLARTNVAGQVGGTARVGSYEGTITVDATGQVAFIAQGAAPTSAYDTWMSSFTTITAPADKLPGADPDKDGATNLEEFGFGGNPESPSDHGGGQVLTVDANADTQKDITLTLEVRSGATFSASGNDLVSFPIDEVTYLIEGSTDLINWDSAVSEVTPALGSGTPSSGYEFKTFRLNAGNGLSGKGFLRASVTK
jgi:hypothetical protein